jgi:hypothetical protein
MFSTGEEIAFGFDEWRRLRITVLPDYRPLAAWLHTDVQPNLAVVDGLGRLLGQAEQSVVTVHGNGCRVRFRPADVVIDSQFGRWPPLAVPRSLFWPVLSGLRSFLADFLADAESAANPAEPELPGARPFRRAEWRTPPDGGPPALVDHTYFPPDWSEADVRAAGQGAWRSAEALFDEPTGTWSGLWHDLELAGYYDPATGSPLTYFPVLPPNQPTP